MAFGTGPPSTFLINQVEFIISLISINIYLNTYYRVDTAQSSKKSCMSQEIKWLNSGQIYTLNLVTKCY